MVFKKKQTRSKKQPHWKELALLLSKKRQLNVVLRREVIPPAAAVASTSEGKGSRKNLSSQINSENREGEDNLASDEEDIIRIKQENVTAEPTFGAPHENNDHDSANTALSGKNHPECDMRIQSTSPSHSDETYNVSINDFQSFLAAATQRSDIRLSIENTYFNLSKIDDHISTEQNDEVMTATRNKKKQNLKSTLTSSANTKTNAKKQYVPRKKILRGSLRNKYNIQDEIAENEYDRNRKNCVITNFDTKTRGRPAKRKMSDIKDQHQDKDQRKQIYTKEKSQEDSSVSNCKTTKRLTRNNAHVIENRQLQVSSVVNVDDTNLNVVADNSTNANVIPVNKTGELERHTKDGSEECVINTEKTKTNREPKSVAYELRSLRRRIIGVSKSQKQIQAALQSTNDRFDLFGKTIAACLRELPCYESKSLEIKLMDVLIEEKRNYLALSTQSLYSNGHNG